MKKSRFQNIFFQKQEKLDTVKFEREEPPEKPASKSFQEPWRYWVIYAVIALLFSFYAYRLFSLQVIDYEDYKKRADDNRMSEINVATLRGSILDRNQVVLARNAASYNVVITPGSLPSDDGEIQRVYRELSEIIDIPVNNGELTDETVKNFSPCYTDFGITQIVYIGDTNAPYAPVRIKCNVSETVALMIKERSQELTGVDIEVVPIREYPTGSLTAAVIGFLGPIPASQEEEYVAKGFVPNRDKVGFAGIEMSMQDELEGSNGLREVEVDGAGKVVRDLVAPIEPVPGDNIVLTIDTRLQLAAETALKNQMAQYNLMTGEEHRYTQGVVVAMVPKTGEVLAMVSYPSYENNRLARLIPFEYYNQLSVDPQKPLLNKAISGIFPPGSVFKIATSVGVLNEKVIDPEKEIDDPGVIVISNRYSPNDPGQARKYVCYTWTTTGAGHGAVDFLKGLSLSCDVYFYKVGGGFGDEVPEGLGIWRLGEYARALGYDVETGIELPGELAGLIPDPTWKRLNKGENWSTGETYIAAVGQGDVTVTPLQVLLSAVTIANDGVLIKPTLIKEIVDADGNVVKSLEPTVIHDITKDAVIHVYDENFIQTGEMKTVEPWVIKKVQEGMRLAVTEGTALTVFDGFSVNGVEITSAGKTGTAEYCDDVASAADKCDFGKWPAHAWYVGYAPYENPEIAVVAFVYNGDEGARLAAPVVRRVMETYFQLKAIDAENSAGTVSSAD